MFYRTIRDQYHNERYSAIDEITDIFLFNNKEARNGLALLDKYLKRSDKKGLSYLLRYHEEDGITDSETWYRDYVDFFIRYFSVVTIAYIIGHVKHSELSKISREIIHYLGNVDIKRYYSINYPLLLPQLLLEVILSDKPFYKSDISEINSDKLFNQFLQVNQLIENDDVYQFLWFLDGGSNDGSDITDVNRILKKPKTLLSILNTEEDNALNESVRGFLDFLKFIEIFYIFLNSIENSLFKSAIWCYHSYWFTKLNIEMRTSIRQFFKGLREFNLKNLKAGETINMDFPQYLKELEEKEAHYQKMLDELVFDSDYKYPLEKEFEHYKRPD